ncbi:hypothetical protein TREMEDRAFT_31472 [Tremella mesenterica DSM 1558]|uniref:uncharacterized protein n=1 Tax=Tremella mesenterica (strain ATCC 24925 / CBS 8224 / DSM 1558 / NBRC 9311 / NRRL Y-6157 / RJB 2259-6 / UBC 559-6) TaxID=578456 RepID=UPI0003F49C74|nr:uncharacterized protein TREMEDRAFT_31472 [Tremella mesenterica DSM 1558]EIW69189.1 hypothetical protein TREMEDRAFT_31472 [Tremella mesenterica DSM 1558]
MSPTPTKRPSSHLHTHSPSGPWTEKRRRISPLPLGVGELGNDVLEFPPTSAHLYYLAHSAHQASHTHLQQVFVPSWVVTPPHEAAPLHNLSSSTSSDNHVFTQDTQALDKAFGLLLLALDLLQVGLANKSLSDRDKVVFGHEFVLVGIKVLAACKNGSRGRSNVKGKGRQGLADLIDLKKLVDDVQDCVGHTAESCSRGHRQMSQVLRTARVRLCFTHRFWHRLSHDLDALQSSLDTVGSASDTASSASWSTTLRAQYLLLKALWEGRRGNDSAVKGILKEVYRLMDEATEKGSLVDLRGNGGVCRIEFPGQSAEPQQSILIQLTPPNLLYMCTHLFTVIARRDLLGSASTCKNLVHPQRMLEAQLSARAEDMWDIGFSPWHGVHEADQMRHEVLKICAEASLELGSALMFRSQYEEFDRLLNELIDFLRSNHLTEELFPHLCLLVAQYAHAVGSNVAAERYYQACRALVLPGSEFSLAVEIGILGVTGTLEGLQSQRSRRDRVLKAVEACKGSSSAAFNALGCLVASLTDENPLVAKKHLSTAYEIAQRSNNNLLRCLIFAFTTSSHHYGGRDRILKQLETGRDLAHWLGGKDRQDQVGQIPLGVWFAVKLQGESSGAVPGHDDP